LVALRIRHRTTNTYRRPISSGQLGPPSTDASPARKARGSIDFERNQRDAGRRPKLLITHRFKVDRIFDACETFGPAAKTRALKVIIEA
jgi:hypothetical protein